MKELAEKLPDVLETLCKNSCFKPSELTFALEYLGATGEVRFEAYLRSVCLEESESSVVREGAFYGLLHLTDSISDVRESFSKSRSEGLAHIAKCYV